MSAIGKREFNFCQCSAYAGKFLMCKMLTVENMSQVYHNKYETDI